jgi:O-antigen ligase
VALSEWSAHPLLGTGPGSFSYRLPGDATPGPAWLPNLTLQVLHDTGVLGLLAMLWLFVAFYVTTLRALRRAPSGPLRAVLGGLIAAVTALLIAFQLTPGFTLGYSWALLALAVAASGAVTAAGHAVADRASTRSAGQTAEVAVASTTHR